MTASKRKIVIASLVVIVIIVWFIYMNGYKPCKKYSFINEKGETIANLRYEEFEGCIQIENKDYYVFSAHNRFKSGNPLYKEMLFIVDNKGKTIMKSTTGDKGKLSVDTVNNLLLYKNKYVFIDSKGKIIYRVPENKSIKDGKNVCGIVPFYYKAKKITDNKKLFGYVNMKDEVVVEPQFSEAYAFSEEGLARVRVDTEDGKYGFIDTSGQFVISPIYDDAGNFSDGLAWADYDGKVVYIDTKGNVVLENNKNAFDFHDGITEVSNESDKYAYMDKSGNLITEYAFDMAYGFCNGYGLVKVDGREGFVDMNGNIVVEPKFQELSFFSEEGLAGARGENGLYGYINTSGEWVIEPKYACVFDFDNGTSLVEMNK